jgi:hypothetical protein
MPAAVLVEQSARELAVTALRAAFLEVVGFADPMTALDAIEASSRVRVLITRVGVGTRQTERRRISAHGPSEATEHQGCVCRSRGKRTSHGRSRRVPAEAT